MKAFTTEDILTLGRMGYNNEDVIKLMQVRAAEPEPEPVKKEEKQEPEKQPEPKLESKMDELLTLMRGNNIINSQQPPKESTEDILAAIINPAGMQKGE